jgi:hypothetical protein
MKLDGTVCRGSLIIHKGETFVVLGKSKNLADGTGAGWKITPTPKDGEWRIDATRYLDADDCDEVDTFFAGAVFEIPDYIR